MIALVRLAIRNAFRNGRRTALTASTVMIGTAFCLITLSFLGGIFGSMLDSWAEIFGPVRVVTAEYAEKEALQPLHFNIPETVPLLERVRSAPGVAMAEPMIRTGVLVSIGEELGEDPALMVGSTRAWYDAHLLPDADLSGTWLDYEAEDEQVVVGGKVARDVGIALGDEVLMMGTTQYGSMAPISAKVVGVVSGNSTIDAMAFVTLETARWMVDVPEGALEVLVYPEGPDRSDVAEVAATIGTLLGPEYEAKPWMERGMWAQQLPIMDAINVILSGVIVFLMALAIFNTMTMSVLERTGEIGVLRAMGQTRVGAVASFLTEAMVIGVIGGILGVLLGSPVALYLERNGVTYAQDMLDEAGGEFPLTAVMTGDLTADIVMLALFCGVFTAVLGAFFPALRAASIQPYEAMRARR